MRKTRRLILKITAVIVLLAPLTLFPKSNATISEEDYQYTLGLLRELSTIVQNFGTEEQIEQYKKIKLYYQIAAERHYSKHFIKSVSLSGNPTPDANIKTSIDLFYELKVDLLEMYASFADFYTLRTKVLLDGMAREATDIMIEYGKQSPMAKYFQRPVDPLRDTKPYDADKFHYFYHRQSIEAQLDSGYRYLQQARNVYKDVDYMYILAKDQKTSADLDFMIEKHRAVIILSRQAKECGIAVYQTLNTHRMDDILRKYDVSITNVIRYPIYDDRIPEEFKIDATDNRKLSFNIEKKRVSNYEEVNPDAREVTTTKLQEKTKQKADENQRALEEVDRDRESRRQSRTQPGSAAPAPAPAPAPAAR